MRPRAPELYGINISELARICRVSIKTATRWKNGTTCPPATALMILARDLGCFGREWAGWSVNGEDLVSPWGQTINRNDALTVPLMHQQIAALRLDVARAKESAHDGLEEQPEPGSLPAFLTG